MRFCYLLLVARKGRILGIKFREDWFLFCKVETSPARDLAVDVDHIPSSEDLYFNTVMRKESCMHLQLELVMDEGSFWDF